MAIVLRSSKSTPLTFTEVDGNFSDLNSRTNTLENNYVKTINGVAIASAPTNALVIDTSNLTEDPSASVISGTVYFTNASATADGARVGIALETNPTVGQKLILNVY